MVTPTFVLQMVGQVPVLPSSFNPLDLPALFSAPRAKDTSGTWPVVSKSLFSQCSRRSAIPAASEKAEDPFSGEVKVTTCRSGTFSARTTQRFWTREGAAGTGPSYLSSNTPGQKAEEINEPDRNSSVR